MIKHTGTYEPMQPEKIGRERRFIFGKHTGSTAVADKLKKNGIEVTKDQFHFQVISRTGAAVDSGAIPLVSIEKSGAADAPAVAHQ